MNKEEKAHWEKIIGRPIKGVNEFKTGLIDAEAGVPHKSGMGAEYDAAYRVYISLQEMNSRFYEQFGDNLL